MDKISFRTAVGASAFGGFLGQSLWSKALRFAIVGGASSVIFSIATFVLVSLCAVDEKVASVLAYVVSMPINFLGHRHFSFRSGNRLPADLIRFVLLHMVNIFITVFAMSAAVDAFRLPYVFGILGAVVLVPLANFALMNLWVFRNQTAIEPKA